MLSTRYVKQSFKGHDRGENKDRHLVLELGHHALFVVFDGVSSTPDAKECIDIAVNVVKESFQDICQKKTSLDEVFYEANQKILEAKIEDGASTYVALYINRKEKSVSISSLGDSRIYSVLKDGFKQLTTDDGDEVEAHLITKGLGFARVERSDFKSSKLENVIGRFLLCSDGVYEFIDEEDKKITKALHFKKLGNVKKGIDKQLEPLNSDDATYVIIDVL